MTSIFDSLKSAANLQSAPGATDVTVKRRPLTDRDRVLISPTHIWLRQIPGPFQPKQLCRHYPRIANEIARCWDDAAMFERLLTDLGQDKRGGRAGFAPRIVHELQVLREFRARRHRNMGKATVRLRKILGGSTGPAQGR